MRVVYLSTTLPFRFPFLFSRSNRYNDRFRFFSFEGSCYQDERKLTTDFPRNGAQSWFDSRPITFVVIRVVTDCPTAKYRVGCKSGFMDQLWTVLHAEQYLLSRLYNPPPVYNAIIMQRMRRARARRLRSLIFPTRIKRRITRGERVSPPLLFLFLNSSNLK